GLYGEFQGFALRVAGNFSIYSLIALTIGYLIGIVLIPKYLSPRGALIVCASLGFLFVLGALFTDGWLSIGFIVMLSFEHVLMWTSIWPHALDKLGHFTKLAAALLVMCIVGGAILPLVYGALADRLDRQMAYWVTVPCYLYILFYAVKGHKIGKETAAAPQSATTV